MLRYRRWEAGKAWPPIEKSQSQCHDTEWFVSDVGYIQLRDVGTLDDIA